MIGDTICAVSSPAGAAARGVIRISGPDARAAGEGVLARELPARRAALEASCTVLGFPVECLVLVMPGPRSYTGEDVVELHLPGSPLLLEHVQDRLRAACRDALPGEFTRRAYENGRLDLAAAEAVLELVHGASAAHRRHALHVLSGGLGVEVERVRGLLQDALAWLESGLDFTADETGAVRADAWLPSLVAAATALRRMLAAWPRAVPGGEWLLLGAANAGKSSLCNALSPDAELLVSPLAGTTRDVVAVRVAEQVTLLDAPGDVGGPAGEADRRALRLRDRLAARASGVVLVVDATAPHVVAPLPPHGLPVRAAVLTKVDLRPDAPAPANLPLAPLFRVSSTTGFGLRELRAFLAACGGSDDAGAGGERGRVALALAHACEAVQRAADGGGSGQPDELIAADLGDALRALDEVHGRSTPEHLLERIFSRFCLGK